METKLFWYKIALNLTVQMSEFCEKTDKVNFWHFVISSHLELIDAA